LLNAGSYFVVIDDIWDKRAWQTIELALLDNDCGSRIITTTRSVTVASFCSAHGGSVYHMEPLSSNDSKRLFFRRAFGSENSYYPHLRNVPHEILGKCGGLPLAIITISSMLADQHAAAEWERVLNAIGSGLARDPDAERMTNILALSYFDLPHNLKTCLLYLSIFPEDQTIERQCLINKWIAEGFVCDEKGRSAYETGERYFNDLINRSMIQPVGVIYGQAKACRVHDIILDYIKCKAAEDNFLTSLDATDHGYPSEYKVRRLCVINNDEEKATRLTGLVLSHVRSLTIFGNPVQTSFSAFTALRVLDLANCSGLENHHLSSIKKLFNLKYLRLGSHSITYLPDKIGEMQYLETLDVQDTQIKELPSSITKLKRLAHLYVDSGTRFPDGMIGQMQSMEELCKYGLVSYEQGKTLQEFNKLTKLRTLDISWNFNWPDNSEEINKAENFHSHVGNLLSSCSLHNLHIVDTSDEHYPLSLDSWRPASPCRLRKLHLKECPIYKVPDWIPRLGNLGVLELYIICMRPDDVEILGAIRSLLFLELGTAGATNGRIIFNDINGFRNLKYFSLAIDACGTALKFEAGSMPMLEHLKLT
jgi:Leucine-rich repeat (LRR) protein